MGDISKVINYDKIKENQLEFQRTDLWMMSFVRVPSGVYFPGQELIDIRCTSFDAGITDDPTVLSQQLRGYTVHQGARPSQVGGTATATIKDREDQTLSYFIDQWKLAMGDRDSLQGLPKSMYTADIQFVFYNVSEQPLRTIILKDCIIQSGNLSETGSDEPAVFSDISLSLSYQHFTRTFNNR